MKLRNVWYSVIIIVLIQACTGKNPYKKPEHLLNEATYEQVFYEIALLRTLQNFYPPQDTVDSLYHLILEKYSVNENDFLASHQYYQSEIGAQVALTERVMARLEDETKRLNQIDSLRKAAADLVPQAEKISLPAKN